MPIIKNLAGLNVKVVMDGNSLTASNNQYISTKISQYLAPRVGSVEMVSLGVSGQRLQTMFNNATTVNGVYSLVNPAKYNILVVNEDVNGIFQDDYSEYRQIQLMNQYISGAYRAKYNAVISWNTYYSRIATIADPFQPTANDLLMFKNYCNLANQNNRLYSNVHVDLRLADGVGGAENQIRDINLFLDYLHLLNAGNDIVAQRIIDYGFNQIFEY